jgi:multidrug resistance efflux pump
VKKQQHYSQVLLLILLVFLFAGCQDLSTNDPVENQSDDRLTPTVGPSYTSIEAKVVPIREAFLSFAVSGVVEDVIVPEGKSVKKGDVIARLEGSENLSAAIVRAEYEVLQAKQELDLLYDEAELSKARAEQSLAEAQLQLKHAKDARESKDYQQVSKNTLDGLRADFILAQDELKNAEENYQGYQDKPDSDIDKAKALNRLAETRKLRDRALDNLNTVLSRPDPQDVAKADAEVARAQALVDKAQLDFEKVKDGPNPDQLKLALSNLTAVETKQKSSEAGLSDITIKAPFNGLVASNGLKIGQFTSPETSQVAIGDTTEWQIETTDLKEDEIGRLSIGDRVLITIDAYPDMEFFGTVDQIQTFGKDKQGDIVYKAVIIFEQIDKPLFWNMTAAIHIPS